MLNANDAAGYGFLPKLLGNGTEFCKSDRLDDLAAFGDANQLTPKEVPMRWDHTINHNGQPLVVGFASVLHEPAQPRVITPDASRRIRSIDELGSIWQWESRLTWLAPDLLAEGSVNLLSAAAGTGKTWMAYYLAGAVAHGSTVFGHPVSQRKVLYVDGENPAYLVKQRLHGLGIEETSDLKVWGGWQSETPPGPNHPLIREFAEQHHPLLIWDSLVKFHTGDEQSSTQTRKFMDQFRVLANLGATVLILHHTGKSDSSQEYRGSSDIEAAVDMAFLLTAKKDAAFLDELTLKPFKCRLMPLPTRILKYVKRKGFEVLGTSAMPINNQKDPLEIARQIVRAEPGLNQSEIVKRAKERHDLGKHSVEDALKRTDIFFTKGGQGKERLYYLIELTTPAQAKDAPRDVLVTDEVPEPT